VVSFCQNKRNLVSRIYKHQPHIDSDTADVREKLYSTGDLISGHAECNNESAVTTLHKAISEKLTELCGDEDWRSRNAGMEALLKFAGYGEILEHTSLILADII
jgi:hypothetical protein